MTCILSIEFHSWTRKGIYAKTETNPAEKPSFITRIFISSDEPRLRAGWRLLLQTILFIVFSIVVFSITNFIPSSTGSFPLLLDQVRNIVVITGSVYVARRWLDKRSFENLGLKLSKQTLTDIWAGIRITFVQMGFIYFVMLSLGWLTFEGFSWQFDLIITVITGVLTFFIAFIFVGWNEELLSRGYHLQTIASGMNLFWV